MNTLSALLLNDKPDLRSIRIDEALRSEPATSESRGGSPFALHAVQRLELSEERGRLGAPSASDLSEQADAYFALGDFATANEKAAQAVQIDPKQSRAWCIRVMALIGQRNAAARLMQRHQINATEIAEPMSVHEAMEHELADEAGSRACEFQTALDEVLPHALLNWPRNDDGTLSYEHEEQLKFVRNLFVDAVFGKVVACRGARLESAPDAIEVSSCLRYPRDYWRRDELNENEPALTPFEKQGLELLLEERRRHARRWTAIYTAMDTAREFKILHLGWALRLDGYEEQWQNLRDRFENWKSVDFRKHILSDDTLIHLWQFHVFNADGVRGVFASLDRWHARSVEERKTRSDSLALRALSYLYHDRLVRGDLGECVDIALRAQSFTNEATGVTGSGRIRMGSPDDSSLDMPIGCDLYWKYLEALAVVLTRPALMCDRARFLLRNAEQWMVSFRDTEHCFWVWEDLDDPGESRSPPYEVDLRDAEPWIVAARAYIDAFPGNDGIEGLRAVIERLGTCDRPSGSREI